MAPVVVDTSVWVQYFRDPQSAHGDEVERLIGAGEVALVGVVYTELVRGARDERELLLLKHRLEALPFIEVSREIWRRAGELLFQLRRQGVSVPLPDAIIAAIALEGGHQLYTLDEHFQRVPGLRVYEAKGK